MLRCFWAVLQPYCLGLILHSMLLVFRADGALLHHNHALYRFGRTPHDHDSKQLIQWLQNNQTGTVFAAETVIAALADRAGIVSNASGVLSVRFGDGSLLVLVRREFQEAVRWAGQPQHLNVNDAGDQVLSDVALRLRQSVRDSDHIVRLGGDEFVVLLEGVTTEARALELAERALDRLREPFVVKEELVRVHASIGIVLHPLHGNDIQLLMGKADQAMYEVKKTGRNGCRVYS